MTAPTVPRKHGRQLYAVPMQRYSVFLDAATVRYYKARGGGSLAKGVRVVAAETAALCEVVPQSSRDP